MTCDTAGDIRRRPGRKEVRINAPACAEGLAGRDVDYQSVRRYFSGGVCVVMRRVTNDGVAGMGIDESLVQEIVRRILSVTRPDRIIILGSAAIGNMTRDSDIDILVVERNPGNRRKESVRIHHALRGLGYPFDVIVISTEWFEESKNVIGGIAYPANKYGKVIYEAA
ncbi:MAG: nucleotidyltransferase domain-containing protein [Deltaproteobacteria bacterium]|nr:nucleotidyltransferase domain-containing protein [Deltaproteobacteria bacterium]MBW2139182.1 nucleotidyltransferase domain-containing protein [Deltaproteobacteria bacterium]